MIRTLLSITAVLALSLHATVVHAQNGIWINCTGLPGCLAPSTPFGQYISKALELLTSLFSSYAMWFAALFIMIGGAYMVLSAGSSERVEKGKKTIMWAVIGIFLAQFAGLLIGYVELETINRVDASDLVESGAHTLMSSIVDLLYVAVLGVAFFCGMWMVVSQGKQESHQRALTGLFWAAVGAIIIGVARTFMTGDFTILDFS